MVSIKFLKELRWRWETLKNLTLQEGFSKEHFNFVCYSWMPPSQASVVGAILITDDRHMLLVVEIFPAC
jgi:hypothetical protein